VEAFGDILVAFSKHLSDYSKQQAFHVVLHVFGMSPLKKAKSNCLKHFVN